ncbi:MAG: DUF2835 family protein [Verrucomicrobia bacterium]|nr:DUF2835 family protein [Verrucomicrobiota bacterium]
MQRYEFPLRLSPEECLDYYRGAIRQVIVRCTTGQTVQFPAALLQRFVTQDGVAGRFVLTCDAQHKCVSLERVVGPAGTPADR